MPDDRVSCCSSGDDQREQTLEQARQALVSARDHEGAAEADTVLAELWWHRGQGDRSHTHLERARVLVADTPSSPGKARVLSQLSRYEALAERSEQAIALGMEAVAMAEALDLPELQAHALNNVGIAKVHLGDESGFIDLERSIEIALAANSPEAARGYNNLGAITWERGDFLGSTELFVEALRVGKQLGNTTTARYSQVIVEIQQLFPVGRWDEGLRSANAFIAACEAGDRHYLESSVRMNRAHVRLARDDIEGALEDTRVAVERAREAGDPQAVVPDFSSAVFIYTQAGVVDEARMIARELRPYVEVPHARTPSVVEAAWVADVIDLEEPLRQLAVQASFRTRWCDVLLALLDKDFETAGDLFEAAGVLDWEARARLWAAEALMSKGRRSEADEQLRRALDFFRSVGATRYIREGEALLAAAS